MSALCMQKGDKLYVCLLPVITAVSCNAGWPRAKRTAISFGLARPLGHPPRSLLLSRRMKYSTPTYVCMPSTKLLRQNTL